MKRVIATIALVVLVVPVSVGAYLYLSEGGEKAQAATTPVNSIVSHGVDLTFSGINAAIDASGVKEKVDSSLRQNSGAIAADLGVTQEDVLVIVDNLDVQHWEAADLPDNAVAVGSYYVTLDDTQALVTTYDDPSYVTVTAFDQDITFSIPDSAHNSLVLLSVLS